MPNQTLRLSPILALSLLFNYYSYAYLVKATCSATGDPHYTTFDGTMYEFMGKCEYVLAKDSMYNWFEIRQVNEACGNGKVSCTKSVSVIFPNATINLWRGSVGVNGTSVNLPVYGKGKTFEHLVIE